MAFCLGESFCAVPLGLVGWVPSEIGLTGTSMPQRRDLGPTQGSAAPPLVSLGEPTYAGAGVGRREELWDTWEA